MIDRVNSELTRRQMAKEQLQNQFYTFKSEEISEISFKRKIMIKNAKMAANLIQSKKEWNDEYKKLEDFEKKNLDSLKFDLDELFSNIDKVKDHIEDSAKDDAKDTINALRKAADDIDDEIERAQKRIDDLKDRLDDPNASPEDIARINDLLG